ncbi:MAG: putative periplasmic protein (vacJ homolog) [uncultured Sulfurovum sp.]|uniref:Putative periplasmic protein (VacJ homolog) n=1 Tax=uncultured Sulfurovum sp. TaxID=269237 RepID=A0A6S6TY45_9BACT|nr:MAG: putative periplasmic protein (vacJ homolog) [uncultured Sulfurovum sp.]
MNLKTLQNILLLLSLSLLISACSTKNKPSVPMQKSDITKTTNNTSDEFEDEFEEEFKSADQKVFDPLEGYNRWMTSVNDKFYLYVFDPISQGYAFVMPKPARIGLSNAFDNLKFPIRFTNNLLQFKFDSSMKELGRFMINSTLGVLGLFDVAKAGGIEPQDEDFGQTLGYYGVGSGFHVVLPFWGPSNLRDILGLSVDAAISPMTNASLKYQIPQNLEQDLGLSALYYTNKNSLHPGEYESLKKDALDVYTFFRDSYEQKRAKEIEQ